MTYQPPFPIVQQPSIPMNPVQAAVQRQRALASMQATQDPIPMTPGAPGKENFRGMSDDQLTGPNAGIMPPLQPPQEVADTSSVAPVQDQPAEGEAKPDGPTDLTRLGDTAATPVAAAANPLEADVGQEIDTKPKGSFFDNPAASDSLIAFGAAMLQAPNFNIGLAKGAEAVGEATKPYEMPTQAEVARAALKAHYARQAAGGDHSKGYSSPNVGYDAQGRTVVGVLNKDSGMEWTWGDGSKHPTPPADFRMHQDSGLAMQANLNAKAQEEAIGIAGDAPGVLADIDTLQHDYKPGGGGAGVIDAGKRWADRTFGSDIFGNLGSQQTFDTVVRKIELMQGQTQRGLGQLTEGERAIIRDALPSLANDPRAFYRITEMLKAHAERSRDIARAWMDLPEDQLAKYKGSIKRFALDWNDENKYEDRLKSIRSANVPDYMTKAPPAPGATTAPTAAPADVSKYY
jgi:hypothetical protein